MRRQDKEITEKEIINKILSKSDTCRIAMYDNDFPYIVPLNYGYFDNAIYFHSSSNGKKIDLLKKNNKVCFEIECANEIIKHEQSCHWTTKYRSIIGFGKVDIITDFEQKKRGLEIIMEHYGKFDNVFNNAQIDKIVILKLNIVSISGKQSGDWEKIEI
jgi:nitroimidazol reductase NimA-like FMN-containing flavoprotein (pyridoxamine 5'-phosphate oxidase superfamily)